MNEEIYGMVWYGMVIGGLVITSFTGFTNKAQAGDATLTLDDNAGSSSFVVQDADKTNQFKVNSDGQGYFAGKVGIGTTSPDRKLHVFGTGNSSGVVFEDDNPWLSLVANSASNRQSKIHFYDGTTLAWTLKNDFKANDTQTFSIRDDVAGSDRLIIDNNGNLGIGTTAPAERLDVAGNIKASGTVSQGSSRDLKKNIAFVSTKDAMNALNKLNPVRFEYKTDNSGEKHLGFIAEDVPDLVAENDRKHLNSMDITAVLTKVVQEQQRLITALSAKVNALEDKINQ